MLTATLIAAGRLDDRLLDRALGLLRELDPKAQFGGWIDEGDAVDLRVSAEPSAVRWALEALPQVDVVVQAEEPRFRKLLVADMDSTIIGQECIDELADFAGLKREVADITERAMQGKLDFKAALRERVALLSGLEEDAIARITGSAGSIRRASSACTSSIAPLTIIAPNRASQRAYSQGRGGSRINGSKLTSCAIPPERSDCQSAKLRPVESTTSSARAVRALSPDPSRAAPSGSAFSSRARFSSSDAARTSLRTSGSTGGTGAMPSTKVRR